FCSFHTTYRSPFQIHWKRYPEFQIVVQSEQGQRSSEMKFRNPYDKGILQNVKEFMCASRMLIDYFARLRLTYPPDPFGLGTKFLIGVGASISR
uniref:Uncharacterized protein n=1 Tax=Cucumis melo TaxID=3656 RepID=A0A9I9EKF9_CUCME